MPDSHYLHALSNVQAMNTVMEGLDDLVDRIERFSTTITELCSGTPGQPVPKQTVERIDKLCR